jgi:hypothetical protein
MTARPLFALASLALAAPLAAQTPAVREDLDALSSALETAVGRVSRPLRTMMANRGGSRGYRLPGYGAMIVLAPRPLPTQPAPRAAAERETAQVLARAAQQIEQSLQRVPSEEMRRQLEQNLKALRDSEAALRRSDGAPREAAATPTPEAPAPRNLAEMQAELARQADAWQRAASARGEMDAAMQEELDSQLRAMHQQAEAFRLGAERALLDAQREVRRRVPGAPLASDVAGTPEPPGQPAWPWFDFDDEEPAESAASPEEVMGGVRTAITTVLEAQGSRLQHLGPDEVVAVAIDFIPSSRMSFRPRAQKTLVVRVSKRTIEARRAGRLSPEDFRKRVEVLEY